MQMSMTLAAVQTEGEKRGLDQSSLSMLPSLPKSYFLFPPNAYILMETATDFPDIYLVTTTMKTFVLTITLYQAYFAWFFVTKPVAS